MAEDTKKNSTTKEKRYKKSQLIYSKKYRDKKDLLNALLDENKMYSFKEIDTIIDNFLKKEVN